MGDIPNTNPIDDTSDEQQHVVETTDTDDIVESTDDDTAQHDTGDDTGRFDTGDDTGPDDTDALDDGTWDGSDSLADHNGAEMNSTTGPVAHPVVTSNDVAADAKPPHQFSIAALLFGAVILGLGLAGVVVGTSHNDWNLGLPIGWIAAGLIATVGLITRWRRLTT